MIAQADLIVGRVVSTVAANHFALSVALKTCARRNVEDSIGTIAVFGAVATGGRLQVVHVLRVKLWPDIRGNVGVRQRHAINGPGHLMAAAHMKLIMHNVGSRNKLRDDAQAVALVHGGIAIDLPPGDRSLRGGSHRLKRSLLIVNLDGFMRASGRKLEVKHRRASAAHEQLLLLRCESSRRDGQAILANRKGVDLESACRIALKLHTVLRSNCSDLNIGA